ncbi:MAG: hypothetical protein DHS20C18_41360 [Saprospiraceae bacterium]|nr:MAG: hypothetical protein DHS20C18_41360 [Saprospiraceae bacterium]
MKNIFLLLIGVCFTTYSHAQQELGTHFMQDYWQSTYTNPGLMPNGRIIIGLPGLYNNLLVTNVTFDDILTKDENGDRRINVSNAIPKLGPDNYVREDLDIETVSLGLRLGKVMLTIGHKLRFNTFVNYPKTFPQLVWEGNAQFVGQNVEFGPDIQASAYHEIALGGAYQIGKHFTIGGRVKFLSGVTDVSTDRTKLSLYTSDDVYQLDLDADFRVNTSGALEYNGFDDLAIDFNFGRFETKNFLSKNSGMAFDLGATAKFGKLGLAASILDIGEITWKEEAKNYSLLGHYEFQGLDIARDILDDSTDIGSALDTLQAIYEPTETSNSYKTKLPSRVYLSATYQLTEKLQLGGLFYTERFRGENFPAVALSAQYQLNKYLRLGGLLAYRNETFDNVGVNAAVVVGPVQVIAATDNLLTVFSVSKHNNANLRLGVNFVLGEKATETDKETESFF